MPSAEPANVELRFHPCNAFIRMTQAECTYVEEIPGAVMWWEYGHFVSGHTAAECARGESHFEGCTWPSIRETTDVHCALQKGHAGEHSVVVGRVGDGELDLFLYWVTGVPGARDVRQSGGYCQNRLAEADESCCLAVGHPGGCRMAPPE